MTFQKIKSDMNYSEWQQVASFQVESTTCHFRRHRKTTARGHRRGKTNAGITFRCRDSCVYCTRVARYLESCICNCFKRDIADVIRNVLRNTFYTRSNFHFKNRFSHHHLYVAIKLHRYKGIICYESKWIIWLYL